jgi:hypothetical protein
LLAAHESETGEKNLDEEKQQPAAERRSRRPYEKPVVAWEEMLEVRKTLAVACAKVAGRSGLCNQFPAS